MLPDTFEPSISVIGNTVPIGICGSGMIDAISELFLSGVIDQKGKFVHEIKTGCIREGDEGAEFVLHKGAKDIVLTEVDIENIMRAKAAIYAGISLLIKEVGFTLDNIERVYIAGGFGNYLNVDRAVIIGMLPDIPKEKFRFLGNTSVTRGVSVPALRKTQERGRGDCPEDDIHGAFGLKEFYGRIHVRAFPASYRHGAFPDSRKTAEMIYNIP